MYWFTGIFINILILIVYQIHQECSGHYIISNELILNDDTETGTELINLNKLLSSNGNNDDKNYLFKIVNDTSLVSYIDLKYVNNDKSVIVLVKRLNFEDLCDGDHQQQYHNDYQVTCTQSLKIVAVNENDFIEIPIQIHKIDPFAKSDKLSFTKKDKISMKFGNASVTFNASALVNSYELDKPVISYEFNDYDSNISYENNIIDKIEYRLEPVTGDNDNYFTCTLNTVSFDKKLQLNVTFLSDKLLKKASSRNVPFGIRLIAIYDGYKANMDVNIKVTITNVDEDLKPLDFEFPIYSIAIENKLSQISDVLLEPKLKDIKLNDLNENKRIVFSIFQNDGKEDEKTEISGVELPFYVDEDLGTIRLKRPIWSDISGLNENDEQFFSFGIKATYRKLTNQTGESNKINYYYDYMIPAFAKIQISFRREHIKVPIIRSQKISPQVAKYEILNEESNNQTFIIYINDPVELNSKLIDLVIDFKSISTNNYNYWLSRHLKWTTDTSKDFYIDSGSIERISILNGIEFKDMTVYRVVVKLVDSAASNQSLSTINLEFRVDFDPLLFEKPEYSLTINRTNIIEQNLMQIKLKQRVKLRNLKKKTENSNGADSTNIVFKLESLNLSQGAELFEINSISGWISAKSALTPALNNQQSSYEFNVIALNSELQKSVSVKLRINIACSVQSDNQQEKTIKFTLFENSPNRTQIGSFKSVCTDTAYAYGLENQNVSTRICTKSKAFCHQFKLNISPVKLFDIPSSSNAYLISNTLINSKLLLDAISQNNESYLSEVLSEEGDTMVFNYDSYTLTILFDAHNVQNNQKNMYNIEILMKDAPKLMNFHSKLVVESNRNDSIQLRTNKCLYKYKLSTDTALSNEDPLQESEKYTSLTRFVKIDDNSAHMEAEFKQSDCSAYFYIYNNGCLALKYDHLLKYLNESNKCNLQLNPNDTSDFLILKAAIFTIKFKLCYYDTNKVSCSEFYEQNIQIPKDIYDKSSLSINTVSNPEKLLKQVSTENKAALNIAKPNSYLNVYFIILLSIIIVAGLITIIALIVIFARPKFRKDKSIEKIFVLPSKSDIDFKSSDSSSDSSSRTRNNSSSPETASNTATTTSKISKLEDENEEIVKIQVSDDYLSLAKNLNSINYQNGGYKNNNFSYAGSFSSINSSTDGTSCGSTNVTAGAITTTTVTTAIITPPIMSKSLLEVVDETKHRLNNIIESDPEKLDNDHGLYSVKNASIKFNTSCTNNSIRSVKINNLSVVDAKQEIDSFARNYDLYSADLNTSNNKLNSSNCYVAKQNHTPNDMCSIDYNNSDIYNSVMNSNVLHESYQLNRSINESDFMNNQIQLQLQLQAPAKTSSLKKLKKEIALKKAAAAAAAAVVSTNSGTNVYSNLNNDAFDSPLNNANRPIQCDSNYQYLNNKEILLNPDEIIASVV